MNLLWIFLITVLAQGAAPQQPASVEGVVVKMGSGEPLPGVKVQLMLPSNMTAYTTTTTREGKFLLEKVVPGTYRLVATSTSSYVPAEYGQRSVTGLGISFALGSGQSMTGVQLAMAPTGSISGRIYDRDGEPVGKAQVQAMRSIYKDGKRELTIVQSVATNDRGEYRLFWLPPGRYYVSAKPDIPEVLLNPGSAMVRITEPARFSTYEQASSPVVKKRTLKSGEVVEETYMPVYYPGTLEMQDASAVAVAVGATISGIDVSVGAGLTSTHHISGRVINSRDGQPIARATVRAIPRSAGPMVIVPSAHSDSNGIFDIPGAARGSYLLFATNNATTGMVPIDVGNTDLHNIAIVATDGFKLPGRFVFEGRSPAGNDPKYSDLRIARLVRDPTILGVSLAGPFFNRPTSPDGSFELEEVGVGDFRVTLQGLPTGAYIKSMRMGNADVLDGGLQLRSAPENPLEIVISLEAGSIAGNVVNARGEPLPNRTVVLVPDVRLRHRNDLFTTTVTNRSGQFQMQGLTPGDYKLFAWEDVEAGAWQDPEFMRPQENSGLGVHVGEGSHANVQLTVIP